MSKFKNKATIRGFVLTRKVGDKIVVNGGELTIEVVEIHGQIIRLAFAASKDIKIQRGEKEVLAKL